MACHHCRLPYPPELLVPMFVGSGYTQPVCGICALAITNRIHGANWTHFQGEMAEDLPAAGDPVAAEASESAAGRGGRAVMSRFDRGMEDAYYGFGPASRYHGSADYLEGYAYGESLLRAEYEAAERAHYDAAQAGLDDSYIRLECEHYQHEPYGAGDRFGARCYCGKVRWLAAPGTGQE